MQRKGSAVWQGGLKDGKGSISTDSGVLKQTQYSFSTRFENGVGTNPEELLAAAHAGCFTMALSAQLGNAGMTASRLETTATITLDKLPDGFAITKSHLDLVAANPRCGQGQIRRGRQSRRNRLPRLETLQGRNQRHRPAGILGHRAFSPDVHTKRFHRTITLHVLTEHSHREGQQVQCHT